MEVVIRHIGSGKQFIKSQEELFDKIETEFGNRPRVHPDWGIGWYIFEADPPEGFHQFDVGTYLWPGDNSPWYKMIEVQEVVVAKGSEYDMVRIGLQKIYSDGRKGLIEWKKMMKKQMMEWRRDDWELENH